MYNLYDNKGFQIKNRLMKAKDIHNVVNNIKKDKSYYVEYGKEEETEYVNIFSIQENVQVKCYYIDNRDDESGYKQYIKYILY